MVVAFFLEKTLRPKLIPDVPTFIASSAIFSISIAGKNSPPAITTGTGLAASITLVKLSGD